MYIYIYIYTRMYMYIYYIYIYIYMYVYVYVYVFVFCIGFLKQNFRPKYAPSRRTDYTLKWRIGEAAPPIYFICTHSRRGIFCSNFFDLKIQAESKQMKLCMQTYAEL